MAIQLEKPVLRLYSGPTSPVLWYWFCIEPASEKDIQRETENSDIEPMKPSGRRSKMKAMLRKLQKTVEDEKVNRKMGHGSMNHRVIGAEEVEYLV